MNLLQRRALTGTSLLVIALLFIASVMLVGVLFRGVRLDLTANQLYTVSDGTRAVVNQLDEPVQLYFYFSEQAAADIPHLRTYAQRVRELLEEIAAGSGGKVRLEVIDPEPFSEAEDRATAAGLQGVPLGNGQGSLFFGLAGTNSTDGAMAIPFFQPDKEAFLEYDVAKLINGLSGKEKPVIGMLSTLEIGPGFDPAARRVTDGAVVYGELKNLFEVKQVEKTVTSIDEEIELLMLVHPKGLSTDTLYAIDQFVMRGGRLIVFVDPHAEMEQAGQGVDPTQAMFESKSSNLDTLFKAWGIKFDPEQVVLDAELGLPIQSRPDRGPSPHLAILGLGVEQLNQNDVVSAQLEAVNMSTAGHFVVLDGATANWEALAQSSANSTTVATDRVRFLPDPDQLFNEFVPSKERYVLAGRLSGQLNTAFPDRSGDGHLSETREPANVILFADTDLLTDRLWVQVQQFFSQKVMNAFANNGDFIINAADNMVGSADLISVRTRPSSARPFDTVEALKRAADDRFRSKERELQAQLSETERKLSELQDNRSDQSSTLLTEEQRQALERFQDEKLRIRKELRQVQHQLNDDIQKLGTQLKFLNILGVPLVLTVIALVFALLRLRQRKEVQP
ncbi:GldG family protein [Pseudomarimonas arenosa]|uniref:Gldg family protein n=1 Tax=Pseudomarimonas arenosa TaxID=2774145 RepID=A0AAW3ZJP5_9GAMM|nr:Gldg family protein [Pseudomarimonas arenosa]MBD8524681.1 Gldg family protein [Pseudomarimonas arenosa]